MREIIERWKELDWLPPYPNLDRHLEHILGGMAVVLILVSCGAEHFTAAWCSTLIFFLVEFLTAIFVGNWRDSTFDFIQYQFHWPWFFASTGNWYLFGVTLAALIWLYIKLLLARW